MPLGIQRRRNFPKTFAQDIKIEAKIRETMRDADRQS